MRKVSYTTLVVLTAMLITGCGKKLPPTVGQGDPPVGGSSRSEGEASGQSQPLPTITLPVADFKGVDFTAGPKGEQLQTITQFDANFDFPTGRCTTVGVKRSGYYKPGGEFVPHGKEVGYYPDDTDPEKVGKLKLEIHWFEGKLHGPCSQLFKSGQKYLVCSFNNGDVHGRYQEWHKDGKPALDTHFDHGKEVGTVTKWYTNGQMRSRCTVVADQFEGSNEFWWENGKRGFVRNYKSGKLHGKTESWDDAGRKEGEAEWVDGKPVLKNGVVSKSTFKQIMEMLAKNVAQHGSGKMTYSFAGQYILLDALGEPTSRTNGRQNEESLTYRCTDGRIVLTGKNLADFIVTDVVEW